MTNYHNELPTEDLTTAMQDSFEKKKKLVSNIFNLVGASQTGGTRIHDYVCPETRAKRGASSPCLGPTSRRPMTSNKYKMCVQPAGGAESTPVHVQDPLQQRQYQPLTTHNICLHVHNSNVRNLGRWTYLFTYLPTYLTRQQQARRL